MAAAMSQVSTLFDAETLALRVDALAREIAGCLPPDLVLVVVMKGGMVFAADLLRALARSGARPRLDVMQLRSYGMGMVSRGAVELVGPVPSDIAGRAVLIVDDIADSGRSLDYARRRLLEAGASEVRICALLDKPSRRVVAIPLDFVGFTIDDVFVVGYGIDYAEDYRYLPFVGAVTG